MKTNQLKAYFILFLLSLIVPTILVAQNNISGIITEKTKSRPVIGVTLTLISKVDSSKTTFTTNENGYFSKANVAMGHYTLMTNFIGYKAESLPLELKGKPLQLSIQLEPSEISIEEVEISAPQTLTMKGDTMEFDALKFSTREFAEADELVAQIPGVIIDEEGNVTAHGEKVTRIIVDGKEFFSSDPRIALKTLPADIIAKIQLIDEKSDQSRFSGFDDGKRTKVINIVTKPDKRKGRFGKAILAKGNGEKYAISGSLNGFDGDKKYSINLMTNNINETNFAEQGRGGIRRGNSNTERGLSDTYAGAANYSNTFFNKKMEVSSDYNFRSLNTLTHTLSDIEYLTERQANQFRVQDQYSDNTQKEHKFNARVKWDIDSLNKIDFSPYFSFTRAIYNNRSVSETSISKVSPINNSNRTSASENDNNSFGGSLTFMHRFKKPGRTISLSAGGNYNSNDATGLNLAVTSYYRNAELTRIDTNNNKSVTNGYGSGFNTRLSFTENIAEYSRLQVNYNFRNTAGYSNRETFEFLAETGQLGELRDRLSNEFRNDYNYHSAGLSYSYNNKSKLRVQIGANYQHGIRNNDRVVPVHLKTTADFNSLLPEFTTAYQISENKHVELNYNTQTNTPSINNLQDFVNNQNELRITNGNPNLEQEYSHTLRFQYKDINKTSGRSLRTNITVDIINDKIVNSVLVTDTTIVLFPDITLGAGGQYIVPINVNGVYSARLNNSYGLPIKKWKINLQSNTNLYLNHDLAKINEDLINSTSYGFGQTIGFNSNFSKAYIVGLSYTMDGRFTENPISTVKRYQIFNHKINNHITVEIAKKIVLNSSLMYVFNGGILGAPGVETTLWNASVGYKIFKRKNAEIAIRGFDLLNNAQNINRRVNENSISNVTSNTLNRYFLASFTYNLRQFGGKSPVSKSMNTK